MSSGEVMEATAVMETKIGAAANFCRTGGLTRRRKYDKFFVENAMMKTCGPVRFPERKPFWCKASVPLPTPIPLLSSRPEMVGRVRPLQCQ